MSESFSTRPVVVGIDGSHGAIRAARWAVGEVAGTDTLLRLLYCPEVGIGPNRQACHEFSDAAEQAIHATQAAVEALSPSVKIEVDVVEGLALPALIDAAQSAQLLCIGNAEPGNTYSSGFGSTAMTLMERASCPVAVVRNDFPDNRSIIALIDGSANDEAVLDWGFAEADRRGAPLMLLTAYRTEFDLLQKDNVLRDHDERMEKVLEGYVASRAPQYPGVEFETLTAFSTFLRYLHHQAEETQLAIISAHKTSEVGQIVNARGAVALSGSDFSLLAVR